MFILFWSVNDSRNALTLNFLAVVVEKNVTRYFAAIAFTKITKKITNPASVAPSKAHRPCDDCVLPSEPRIVVYKYNATKLVACPSTKHMIQYNPPTS